MRLACNISTKVIQKRVDRTQLEIYTFLTEAVVHYDTNYLKLVP